MAGSLVQKTFLEKLAIVISNLNNTVFVCQRPTPFTLVGFWLGCLCMAHLENTEENGFWPFSHLRIASLAPSAAAAVVPATTYAMVLFFRVESGKKPALHHIRVFKVLPPTAASDATQLGQIAKTRQKWDSKNSWNWRIILAPATIWQVLNLKIKHPETEVM